MTNTIGKTRSNKPIYSDGSGIEDYTFLDHRDAADTHSVAGFKACLAGNQKEYAAHGAIVATHREVSQ